MKLQLVVPTYLVNEPGMVRGSVPGRGVYATIIPGCLPAPHLLTATRLVKSRSGRCAVVLTEKMGWFEQWTNRLSMCLLQLLVPLPNPVNDCMLTML